VPASDTRNSSVSSGSAVKAVCPEIISLFNLAAVTVSSEGTPVFKVSPNKVIKSITSPVAKLLAKVIVEPEIVKELPGFCKYHLS